MAEEQKKQDADVDKILNLVDKIEEFQPTKVALLETKWKKIRGELSKETDLNMTKERQVKDLEVEIEDERKKTVAGKRANESNNINTSIPKKHNARKKDSIIEARHPVDIRMTALKKLLASAKDCGYVGAKAE